MLQFENITPARYRLIVALLAIASGVASYHAIVYKFLELFDWVTLVPGVMFGAVLAFATAWKRKASLAQTLIIIVLPTLAWYLATLCWMAMTDIIKPYFRAPNLQDAGAMVATPYRFGLIGIVTGLVGAALTWAAVAIARPEVRLLRLVVHVALFGAVAGAAAETISYAGTSGPMSYTAFLVFPVWQTGVALLLMNATMKDGASAARHR